ncbi:DNA topoisomerase III [Gilliamella apicola]|nr:DNA topoisomerase III [Gilliamella apicola]
MVNIGWKQLFINTNQLDDDLDRQTLPLITEQDICKVIDVELNEKVTTPPKPFNDATLLDAMINVARYVTDPNLKKLLRENSGLGTEATRPSILKTLYDRGYIEKRRRILYQRQLDKV